MRVWQACALIIITWSRTGVAQTAGVSSDSAALAALEHRVEAAVTRANAGDLAFLDSVYAADFRFKHATGTLQGRAEWLALVRDHSAGWLLREVDSVDVEVHGDVALTTGRIRVRRDPNAPVGGPTAYTIRYARVYVRRAGRWQMLTHHSTAQVPDQ